MRVAEGQTVHPYVPFCQIFHFLTLSDPAGAIPAIKALILPLHPLVPPQKGAEGSGRCEIN